MSQISINVWITAKMNETKYHFKKSKKEWEGTYFFDVIATSAYHQKAFQRELGSLCSQLVKMK